jgi:two-component system, OmpR family, alkaline phosphatase synthesis response regulator PhoP
MEFDAGKFKILLVDDEPDIIEFVSYNLKKEGYNVLTATRGQEALEVARNNIPDLILLDVMLPEMDGIEICREIRSIEALNNIIIAFLTARSEDHSQIAGFEVGGDDYIAKPIKVKVLLSRIKALLKRGQVMLQEEKAIFSKSDIHVDRDRYIVVKKGREIILPKKEFELLNLLISKPGKVFTREEIFHVIWGDKVIVGDRTIDVHIRKLREKIGEETIKTVKGVGYKLS